MNKLLKLIFSTDITKIVDKVDIVTETLADYLEKGIKEGNEKIMNIRHQMSVLDNQLAKVQVSIERAKKYVEMLRGAVK